MSLIYLSEINLSAGGLGVGIDIAKGTSTYIHVKGASFDLKSEDFGIPGYFVMPKWEEMKEVARQSSLIADLWLTGVDIVLNDRDEVGVLEVNGRPGLEIQNINENSLLDLLAMEPEELT